MSENNELVVLNNEGTVNFGSRFFKLKPGTLNIVQPNSQNGTRGNLRISETGQEFKSMRVALLVEPSEERAFYIGEGEMNKKPENLMCFTRNVVRNNYDKEIQGPDSRSKVPQAVLCANCENQSWAKYQQNKVKENIPKCDLYTKAYLIDTEFKLPLQLYVRSKSKKPFVKGMENIARTLLTKFSQDGVQPHFYDVSFTLSTEPVKNDNGTTTYILKLSDFTAVTDTEKEAFGDVYQRFVNRGSGDAQAALEAEAEAQVAADETSIDKVVEGEYITGKEDEVITI